MKLKKLIKWIIILVILWLLRPVFFLTYVYFTDPSAEAFAASSKTKNDASRMNETAIDSMVVLENDTAKLLDQISGLIAYANSKKIRISIAGASHTMGGHTIAQNGIVINTKGLNHMSLDTISNILTVGAGALWKDVIAYLNQYRRSILVMQSNNSFSVGGSVSANCHGWQPADGPIASTVVSLKCITADGKINSCSRDENPELFSLVLGGYGLFGLITEVKLRVGDNERYSLQQYVFPTGEYPSRFSDIVKANNAGLLYGRLCIDPDNFLNEALISVFEKTKENTGDELEAPAAPGIRRVVFRGSANSNYGKALRWRLEKFSARIGKGKNFNRNTLMNEGVEVFENRKKGYTDILHEYFIPRKNFNPFINELKTIIPKYKTDLLNITIRDVNHDTVTFLRYADTDVFGFVMLFNQGTDTVAEKEMTALTRELVNAALRNGGTYYLPYRLHATKEQLLRAYPMAERFFMLKKKYDPNEVFSNSFYTTYNKQVSDQ